MKNTKNNVLFILGTLTICIIFPVISFYIDYDKALIQDTVINTYCWKIETGTSPTEIDRKELKKLLTVYYGIGVFNYYFVTNDKNEALQIFERIINDRNFDYYSKKYNGLFLKEAGCPYLN